MSRVFISLILSLVCAVNCEEVTLHPFHGLLAGELIREINEDNVDIHLLGEGFSTCSTEPGQHGVVVCNSQGYITQLNLSGLGLKGTPRYAKMRSLHTLEVFDISHNSLYGGIDLFFLVDMNVKEFYIQGNNLRGSARITIESLVTCKLFDDGPGSTEQNCFGYAIGETFEACGANISNLCYTLAPTPSPTPAPTSAPTPSPTPQPTPSPTPSPTPPTPNPTPSPTPSPTPAPTPSPTPVPTTTTSATSTTTPPQTTTTETVANKGELLSKADEKEVAIDVEESQMADIEGRSEENAIVLVAILACIGVLSMLVLVLGVGWYCHRSGVQVGERAFDSDGNLNEAALDLTTHSRRPVYDVAPTIGEYGPAPPIRDTYGPAPTKVNSNLSTDYDSAENAPRRGNRYDQVVVPVTPTIYDSVESKL